MNLPRRATIEEMARDSAGAKSCDRKSLEELLLRHLPAVRAYIRLRAGPAVRAMESSSDLAQSVCREALEELPDFRFDGEAAFRSWLFTVAMHKVMDRGRRAASRRQNAETPRSAEASSDDALGALYSSRLTPSAEIADRESIERLERAFDRLPDEQREVLVLAKIAGLTQAEVGRQVGKSEDAVRKILSRALARLTTLLL